MRKRILTMTVAAMTVIAAMTGCNKKDAGSVETTKQNTVTDTETTTAAETTTEVETTTEAETTTEYSYENDPYFDMENAHNGSYGSKWCLIDGDTYMGITGAECIAENVPITMKGLHGTYAELHYYGHNEKIFLDELQCGDEFNTDVIKKIYTVPEQPYIERKYSYIPVLWIGEDETPCSDKYASLYCVRFLCEFDLDGKTTWQLCTKWNFENEYGVDINDYIDYKAYARTIVGITPETE